MRKAHRETCDMRNNSSVQAFTRGLAVLQLLAVHGEMTATQIARALGVHQSSASRLLRSLEQQGYVYKPHFHRFALDIKVLLFAGLAMEHFGEARDAARVCTELHREHGFGAASAMLRDGRLIYLARIHEGAASALTLVDDSSFPVHRSTPGLLLAHRLGKRRMIDIMQQSLRRHPDSEPMSSPEELWRLVSTNRDRRGVLYLEQFGDNRFSASAPYDTPRGPAALTIYSHHQTLAREEAIRIVSTAVAGLGTPTDPASASSSKGDYPSPRQNACPNRRDYQFSVTLSSSKGDYPSPRRNALPNRIGTPVVTTRRPLWYFAQKRIHNPGSKISRTMPGTPRGR
ncbi:MAG: helix-turn-helix domain-containing protein [Chitinivibrionales bacterium]|nr:helix-turn-helix domain-containing protein [Chitinivibrionales bacterium]